MISVTSALRPWAAGRATAAPPRLRLAIAGVLAAYLALVLALALTKRPWVDEAWFALPAWNLLTRGVFATTNLETAGTWLAGLDRYTYWIPPLHLLTQAGWYAIFGFGVLSLRALSMVWGLIALLAIFTIVHRLTGDRRAALLAMAIAATDFMFIRAGGDGRMDMMSASLGFLGIAAYLRYRARSFGTAVLASHTCAAASVLTHPNGVLAAAALTALALFFDRGRIRWRDVWLAAVPYLAGLSVWGVYIAQEPRLFLTQFGGNAAGQPWDGLGSWFQAVWNIYAGAFGLRVNGAGAVAHLRALVLIAYVAGLAGVVSTGVLRRRGDVRALLILLGSYFVLMSLLRRESAHDYLVHIIPFYASILAVWLTWLWDRGGRRRPFVAAAVAGLVLLQVGGVALRASANTYRRHYLPVVEFLRSHAGPGDLIMGGTELGFALGFTDRLIDDVRLGYHSGRHAELIVIDERYQHWFTTILQSEPAVQVHVRRLLAEQYATVYSQEPYVVYRCRQHGASVAAD